MLPFYSNKILYCAFPKSSKKSQHLPIKREPMHSIDDINIRNLSLNICEQFSENICTFNAYAKSADDDEYVEIRWSFATCIVSIVIYCDDCSVLKTNTNPISFEGPFCFCTASEQQNIVQKLKELLQ